MYYLFINNELVHKSDSIDILISNPGVLGAIVYDQHRNRSGWYIWDERSESGLSNSRRTEPNSMDTCWFRLPESEVPPECKAMILLLI